MTPPDSGPHRKPKVPLGWPAASVLVGELPCRFRGTGELWGFVTVIGAWSPCRETSGSSTALGRLFIYTSGF